MTVDDHRLDVRNVRSSDVAAIVELVFNGAATERQSSRVQDAVEDPTAVSLVAIRGGRVSGCLLSAVVPSPPESAARPVSAGPVGYVTDFAVASPEEWWTAGDALLARARERLRELGAERVLVLLDESDPLKRAFLWRSGLTLGAERYDMPLM